MKKIRKLILFSLLMPIICWANPSVEFVHYQINNKHYNIQIARTLKQRQIGLMGRNILNSGEGMLLLFPNRGYHGIWMKNMLIPLTVAWLDENFRVIDVKKISPCLLANCPSYYPNIPSIAVLEISINEQLNLGDKLTTQ